MAIQLSSPQADADAPPSCNAEPELVHRDRALMSLDSHARLRVAERAALYRRCDPLFADWAPGLPAIEYSDLTQMRVYELAELLVKQDIIPGVSWAFEKMIAADRLTSSAMWLVVHMTYAKRVDLGGRSHSPADFKETPEGLTDGSLNMVPVYVGYLEANLLSATPRSWVMAQGHCVAATEAVNAIVGNRTPEQTELAAVSGLGDPRNVCLSVARERELGSFEQLLVSPLTSTEILAGKALSALAITMAQTTVLMLFAMYVLGIPMEGSMALLYVATVVFLLSVIGIGLFISSLCATQQQAIIGAFMFQAPAILLSGYATPVSNMPDWLQTLTLVNPIRHFVVISKGVFLKDLPADVIAAHLWPLALIAVVTLSGATWLFRNKLA